jgi:hypothetical protein
MQPNGMYQTERAHVRRHDVVATQQGADVAFRFAFTTGIRYPFVRHVYVEAPKMTLGNIGLSVALHAQHPASEQAVRQAIPLKKTENALEIIEHMRHALLDYTCMPEEIHRAVMSNMGRLSLAHAMTQGELLLQEDVLPLFCAVAVAYDTATIQQQLPMHSRYLSQVPILNAV